MRFLSILPLLTLAYAAHYEDCKGCKVVSTDGGINWGVEHKKWCIINDLNCDKDAEANQCPGFPEYPCCEECEVITEDEDGQWGVENKKWCSIKASCTEAEDLESEEDSAEETETTEVEDEEPVFCKNPIITDMYTADPAPLVVGDTLYLYTTHDEDIIENDFYTMKNWYVFSTKDMVNWTNHGQVLSLDDVEYAVDRAWAPQAIERNGKFYLYFPVQVEIDGVGGMAVGVAVADSPTGPFKEVLGKPLVFEEDWVDFDPTVFIDDDGQAYLYFGNPELRYVKLNEDMISYDEEVGIVHVEMTTEAFGEGRLMDDGEQRTSYDEGPFFYKINGKYYMVFAGFRKGQENEHIGYSTSDSPTGPWKYQGVLMTEEGGIFTNHPGVADFNGKSYFFYHTGELPGGSLFHRSVCVREFKYNKDGTINPIDKCKPHDEL